jgi:hypothetical protein
MFSRFAGGASLLTRKIFHVHRDELRSSALFEGRKYKSPYNFAPLELMFQRFRQSGFTVENLLRKTRVAGSLAPAFAEFSVVMVAIVAISYLQYICVALLLSFPGKPGKPRKPGEALNRSVLCGSVPKPGKTAHHNTTGRGLTTVPPMATGDL